MSSGRAILTDNERKVISGEKSVNYRSTVRANLRNRMYGLQEDIEILKEHDPELFAEYIVISCQYISENPTFEGVHHGNLDFAIYKNDEIWDQNYYDWTKLSWGPTGGKTGQANTAEMLIKESLVKEMPVTINARLQFVSDFEINTKYSWEIEAADIRDWYRKEIVLDQ